MAITLMRSVKKYFDKTQHKYFDTVQHKKRLRPLSRQVAVAALSFAFVGVYALIALNLSFLDPVKEVLRDFSLSDKFYQMLPPQESPLITIVDLTDLHGRGEIVRTLCDIEACHPMVVGMDAVFEGEKPDFPEADDSLRRVAREYGNIVFVSRFSEESGTQVRSVRSFFAEEFSIHEGVAEMRCGMYGQRMKRTLSRGWQLDGELQPSFATEVMSLYAKEEYSDAAQHKVSRLDGSALNINFSPIDFPVVQPGEVKANRDLIEGRIVLFGAMADAADMHYTPVGKMPGVELQAYAIQTLAEQTEIRKLPAWIAVLLSFLIVMAANRLQESYLRWPKSSLSPFVHHFMGTSYVLGLLTFAFIVALMYVAFVAFSLFQLNIDLGWAIAATAFLATSRSFLDAVKEYYEIGRNKLQR